MPTKNQFLDLIDKLELTEDRGLLQILTGIHRSVLFKYLSQGTSSQVNNVPQSAVSLLKLLLLVKTRSPDLYAEWLTLQQCSPETFEKALPDPEIYKKIVSLGLLKFQPEIDRS